MAAIYTDLALKAAKENLSHEAYLYELAKHEKEQRDARRTALLLRQSGLPAGKTFLTFEARHLGPSLQLQLELLKSGAFLEAAESADRRGQTRRWEKPRPGRRGP